MRLISIERLTHHEAIERVHKGFYLKLVKMYAGEYDEYEIYVAGK